MAQHDYDIANADGATVRADMNSVLEAVASLNSGATAPSTTFAFMWWADTANGLLKRRNSANNAWISVMSLTTGLIIGTDVQAYDAALASLAGLTLASGDVLYATAADTLANLAKGSDGEVLTLASGVPSWAAASGGITAGTPLVKNPFAVNSQTTQAHGLGAVPSFCVLELECVNGAGALGYALGDVVGIEVAFVNATTSVATTFKDATNVILTIANNATPAIARKDTLATAQITAADWLARVTPYLVA